MRKLYFRVDGGKKMGLGHLYRCLSLAEYLNTEFEIFFLTNCAKEIFTKLNKSDYPFIFLEDLNEQEELDTIKSQLKGASGATLVLDGYHFTHDYQLAIKSVANKLVCIDGIYKNPFDVDLLINYNIYASEKGYSGNIGQFALGSPYALLRNSFLKEAQNTTTKTIDINLEVLISFGGTDQLNLSETYLNYLLELRQRMNISKIHVLMGAGFSQNDQIKSIASQSSDMVKTHTNLDDRQLINLFKKCHLAICPGSSTLYELFAVGLPVISGYYVENQILNAAAIEEFELGINLGSFSDAGIKRLEEGIDACARRYDQMIQNQKKLIDGKQKERYLELFRNL